MFMIVSYPWPVPSAHVQLTGTNRRTPDRKPQDDHQPTGEPDQDRRILVSSKA